MRRTVPAVVLALGLVVAGCSRDEPGTDQLAAELAKVTDERVEGMRALYLYTAAHQDAADLQVKLAESAVKDPGNCQLEVEVTGENLAEARDWLAGKRPTDPAARTPARPSTTPSRPTSWPPTTAAILRREGG